MPQFLLVPLDDTVVFPHMTVTLPVDAGDEDRILLVPRHENAYGTVGTVAEVVERIRLPGGGHAIAVRGLHRGIAGAAHASPSGALRVEVDERPDDLPVDGRTRVARRRRACDHGGETAGAEREIRGKNQGRPGRPSA